MKNLNPFRRDTADQIRYANVAASEAAARLLELRDKLDKALVDTEDLETITKADAAVGAQERVVQVLQHKISTLDRQRQQEHRDVCEQKKAAALAVLEKALRAETEAAVRVVEGFVAAANAYGRYKEVTGEHRPWSDLLPADSYHRSRGSLLSVIRGAFYWGPMAEHGLTDVPKHAIGLIERLRADVDRVIADLRAEPIPRSALQLSEPEQEQVA